MSKVGHPFAPTSLSLRDECEKKRCKLFVLEPNCLKNLREQVETQEPQGSLTSRQVQSESVGLCSVFLFLIGVHNSFRGESFFSFLRFIYKAPGLKSAKPLENVLSKGRGE